MLALTILGILCFFIERFFIKNLYKYPYRSMYSKENKKDYLPEHKVKFSRGVYFIAFILHCIPVMSFILPFLFCVILGIAFSERDVYFSKKITDNKLANYFSDKV